MILKYIVLPLLFYSFWWRSAEGNEGNPKGNGNHIEDCGMNKAVKKVIVTSEENGRMNAVFICGEHAPEPISKKNCPGKKLRNVKCKNKSGGTHSTNKTSDQQQSCTWRRDACIVNDKRQEIARGGRCDDNSAVDIRCCNVSCIKNCQSKKVDMKENFMVINLKKHEVISDFYMNKRSKRSGNTKLISYTRCEDCGAIVPVVVPVVVIGDGDTCPFPDLSKYNGNSNAIILGAPTTLDVKAKRPLELNQAVYVRCGDDSGIASYVCFSPGPTTLIVTSGFTCPAD